MPEQKRESRRIPIVEDEQTIVECVDRILRAGIRGGDHPRGGTQPFRATETSAPFDLIVADVIMSGMSGPDMVALLRKQQPDVPVLHQTGFNEQLLAAKPSAG